jgi:hypothetical protein
MAWVANIVFYNLFRFEKRTQKFFTYPVLLLMKNKWVKDRYQKRGVTNPEKEVVKALENPEVGISSILSGGHYMVLFFLLTFGIVNFVSGWLRTEFNLSLAHFIVMGLFSYVFPYWISFRQDRYLEYFEEFENLPDIKKVGSAWMTFFIVMGVWVFSIGSFFFLNYRF